MHWLSEQLAWLDEMGERFAREKASGIRPVLGTNTRETFRQGLDRLTAAVAAHPGVTAAFVAHDGLALATAGNVPNFDAIAATAQVCLSATKGAAMSASLGGLRQTVLVGQDHKLALFVVGQMVLGILAPSDTNLATVLSTDIQPGEVRAGA